MKFAYADPPYLGQGKKHYADQPHNVAVYDAIEGHEDLISQLVSGFPDGWALSASSPSLRYLLPLCPEDCRVMAWVKPFAVFKVNVGIAYAWEPVIVHGGRKRTREQPTVRDWISCNITLRRGFIGAKPEKFVHWILDILNAQEGDEVVDLFPGSGACSIVIDSRINRTQHELLLHASNSCD